jgi:hypothetical protein
MVAIEDLKGMTFQAESGGHTFQISGVDDSGNTVALTGSVAGVFLRPDNTDVAISGSVSDGVASVTLPANCYDVPGRFGLTVFITADGQKTAVYAAVGTVSRTSSGTVSPGTTADVVDLINQINAAVATIPASWTGLMADIAPTYSNAAVYPVGAYCYYNGDLYRCTTVITTAESWTAGHWTQAVLGNDVANLKDAIGNGYYSVTYNTRYPYVTVPVANKLYIGLKSITGTVTSVVVRGAVGETLTTEATLTLEQLPKIVGISGTGYDSIRVYFNLSAVNSGTIVANIFPVNDAYDTVSNIAFNNYFTIFEDAKRNVYCTGDLYKDVNFVAGSLSNANFLKSNVFNYASFVGAQSYGSQVSDLIALRKENGQMFAQIYFCIPESLGNGGVMYTYDRDGNPAHNYDASNIQSFPQNDDWYALLYNYHSNPNLKAVYDPDKTYRYTVGTSQNYTSFYQCMKEIAKNPYQKIVDVYAGEYDLYDEIGGDTYAGEIAAGANWANVNVLIPPKTKIIGHGNVALKMLAPNMPDNGSRTLAPINTRGGVEIENVTIVGSNVHYCVHVEGGNQSNYNGLPTVFRGVTIMRETASTGARNNGTMIGVGLNQGCDLIFDNCKLISKCNYQVIFMHTNASGLSPTVAFINSVIDTEYANSVNLGITVGEQNTVNVDVNNCYISGNVLKALTSGSTDTYDVYAITAINTNDFTVSTGDHVTNEIDTVRY